MMNLAEYRNSATRLADFLPWAALVASGIVADPAALADPSVPLKSLIAGDTP